MFGDKPNRLVRRHPIKAIEPRQVYRARVTPQGALESKIEVNIEIAHRELAQRAIDRLAVTAAGEVRFRNCAPMTAHFENRDHVISVLLRFQIENQWRKAKHAQRSRGKDSSFQARGGALAQDLFRRSRRVTEVVRNRVEKSLNAGRCFQSAQFAQLGRREPKIVARRCRSCDGRLCRGALRFTTRLDDALRNRPPARAPRSAIPVASDHALSDKASYRDADPR